MSGGGRRPDEAVVVVRRPGAAGPEYLVLLRSPLKEGYWHLVAGGVEWGEEPRAAATRELREETGLDTTVDDLGLDLAYELPEASELALRFPSGTRSVRLHAFVADAAATWEPTIDEEHVDWVWLSAAEAQERLRFPEPRTALRAAVGREAAS